MALFDFIRNFKNNNTPQIQAVVQDQPIMNSKTYPIPGTIAEQPQGNGLFNKIRGKIGNGFNGVNLFDKYENPTNEGWGQTTDENGDTVLNTAAGTPALTKRGFLNDLGRGMNENFYNKFNVNNWGNNTIDNMPKNFANRLGEGLGSFTRFLSGVGGDAWTAGTQGLNAALERQKVRTGDQLYRNALKDYGYNTDDIGGYIDKDIFNSIANTGVKMQNSMYQNALRKLQIEKQQIINSNLPEMQKAKLIQENAKAQYAVQMQEAKINAYNNGMALGWANYGLRADKAQRDAQQQALENQATQDLINAMNGGNNPPASNGSGKTKSGVNYKVVG